MANRSVKLLKSNLVSTIGDELANKIQLSTFHSFCGTMLEHFGSFYSEKFNQRRLMDDASWRAFTTIFLRKSIKINGNSIDSDVTAVSLQRMLSDVKSQKLTLDEASKRYKISKEYIQLLLSYLEKNGMMMYLDLITDFLKMVSVSLSEGNLKIPTLSNYKVVIVDEFQDMYHELLKVVEVVVNYPSLLDQPDTSKKHLTIAGDPNQSIYEFLGSSPNMMLNINEFIPGYETIYEVLLSEIFRSTPEIMNAANEISLRTLELGENSEQATGISLLQPSVVVRSPGHKPIITNHISAGEEHFFIAKEITRLICELGGLLTPSDFVILTRTNQELEQIDKLLCESYDFKCNKLSSTVMWTYSRLLLFINILLVLRKRDNGGSNFPLLCILQILDAKGSKRISNIFNQLQDAENLEDYFLNAKNEVELRKIYKSVPEKLNEVQHLLKIILQERENIIPRGSNISADSTPYVTPNILLRSIFNVCEKADLLPYINQQENLNIYLESFNRSLHYCYKCFVEQQNRGTFLDSFLEFFIRNYGDQVPITDKDMINLSTVHSAKGLEFPVVFVTGSTKLYYQKSNYWESLFYGGELEGESLSKARFEKARLFYVASTRAKHLLYIGTLKNNPNTNIDALHLNIRAHISDKLPKLTDRNGNSFTLLERLSEDLTRPMPLKEKLLLGDLIFTKFQKEYRPPQPKFRYNSGTTVKSQVFKRTIHTLVRSLKLAR